MPRGGRRSGRPGVAYTNRTDLNQPVRTAPSQTYGDAAAQERAQRAIPLPQQAGPTREPFTPTPLNAPSYRPTEPITAGMAVGAGPGPSVLAPSIDPVVETLKAAYQAFPTPGVMALIEALDR